MVKYAFYFFSLMVSFSALALDKVTASVDKNPAIEGESLVLEVIANDSVDTNALDTSILLKDFIVGRISSSSQTRIINGQSSRQTKWTTVLIPTQTGQVIIPALNVDGITTQPITLNVLDKSNSELQKNKDIFITAATNKNSVYVQEQLSLTIKLHFGVALESASLSEPIMENATITPAGKDKQTEEIINGRRYQVIERQYTITPLSSGDYSLDIPVFSGQINVQSRRRGGVFGFPETKPVSVITDAIDITVKPQPASFQGTWLPSELITLHQEWQPDLTEFKVGEPITRTITLNAVGLTKEQLPSIEAPIVQGIKIYPDQPQLHSGIRQQRLVSQAVMSFAIVASDEGAFELPEVRIPWWNTVTNKQEVAVLPAQRIFIQANPDFSKNQNNVNNSVTHNSNIDNDKLPNNLTQATETQTVIIKEHSWLQWLFLVLWLLTSFIWALSYWLKKHKKELPTPQLALDDKPFLALQKACKNNEASQALSLITPWIQSLVPNQTISNIHDAKATMNDDELNNEIKNLQASLYSKSPHTWQGEPLLVVIKSISKKKLFSKNKQGIVLNP